MPLQLIETHIRAYCAIYWRSRQQISCSLKQSISSNIIGRCQTMEMSAASCSSWQKQQPVTIRYLVYRAAQHSMARFAGLGATDAGSFACWTSFSAWRQTTILSSCGGPRRLSALPFLTGVTRSCSKFYISLLKSKRFGLELLSNWEWRHLLKPWIERTAMRQRPPSVRQETGLKSPTEHPSTIRKPACISMYLTCY